MSTPPEIVVVTTQSGLIFTFMFDDCLHHHGEYALAAMRNSTNCGTELGVGLRWPDPIIGRRHAVLASCVGTSRQEALVTGCLSLAEWIEAQRAKMHPKPGAMPKSNELPEGWESHDYGFSLVRVRDGARIVVSPNCSAWEKQIEEFEFREGVEWTPSECAALRATERASLIRSIAGAVPDLDASMKATGASRIGGAAQQVPVASAYPALTEEMLVRGKEAKALFGLGAFAPAVTEEEVIYRAMAAVAPVELVSAGELATLRERDEALAKAAHFEAEAKRLAEGPPIAASPVQVARFWMHAETSFHQTQFDDSALTRLTEVIRAARLHGRQSVAVERRDWTALSETNERLARALGDAANTIASKDVRIAELKTILAEKAKSETPSDTKPAPAPKEFPARALKPDGGDPRRMGPT